MPRLAIGAVVGVRQFVTAEYPIIFPKERVHSADRQEKRAVKEGENVAKYRLTKFRSWILPIGALLSVAAAQGVSAAPLAFTGNWAQSPVYFGAPAFGPNPRLNIGTTFEIHQFGAGAVGNGTIVGTNLMPGVFLAAARATQQDSPYGGLSQAQTYVQFVRPFNLAQQSRVVVGTTLTGTLTSEDAEGDTRVRYNAGTATAGGTLLSKNKEGLNFSNIEVIGSGTKPINNLARFNWVNLAPGNYQLWGALEAFGAMEPDIFGGDAAESTFGLGVNAQVFAVPQRGAAINGGFEDGLFAWNATENPFRNDESSVLEHVTAVSTVSPVSGSSVAELSILTSGFTASLSQEIATPFTPFLLEFDYLFTTPSGSLDVFLDNVLLDQIVASGVPGYQFSHGAISVSDPLLLGRDSTLLSFVLSGPTGSTVQLDNVGTVPEPGSMPLVLAALCALGVCLQRPVAGRKSRREVAAGIRTGR